VTSHERLSDSRGADRGGGSHRRLHIRAVGNPRQPSHSNEPRPTDTTSPLAAPGLAISAVDRTPADPTGAAFAGNAINDFGLELLRKATAGDGNAVLSPASIALALAMARLGARGETALEMDEVLREVASDEHAGWLNALDAALAVRSGTFKDRGGKDVDVVLRIANSAFAQSDFPWEEAYLDALASSFGAGLRLVDYKTEFERARLSINAWVDEQTERRIPELLAQGTVDKLTRLVLVNAIYLKAAWLTPFEKGNTASQPFWRLDGSSIDVPTMRVTAGFGYAEGDGWRAVELPYVGGSLAMTMIVPDNLAAFEATIDQAAFAEIVATLEGQRVELSLPKFGIESKPPMTEVLLEMGMERAFDPNRADFSGMTTVADLFISDVIHQANIDVDEEGTEAAAATAVNMSLSSGSRIPPVQFKVDRPFLFAVRDVPTGAILFLGRVVEPEIRD
jgi:serpin B